MQKYVQVGGYAKYAWNVTYVWNGNKIYLKPFKLVD